MTGLGELERRGSIMAAWKVGRLFCGSDGHKCGGALGFGMAAGDEHVKSVTEKIWAAGGAAAGAEIFAGNSANGISRL